jgi:hypothetical protein
MHQTAPDPTELFDLVEALTYRPGWTFTLEVVDRGQGSEGLTLDIVTRGYDSYHPERGEVYRVHHFMPVPPAAYDRPSWQRWVFEQILLVERHEACEFFALDGERPYAPNHGPGHDPYVVRELTTDEARRTSFRGDRNP